MKIDIYVLDFIFIVTVLIGFWLIPVLQVSISTRYVQRLTKKVGPHYWGSLYGSETEIGTAEKACITLYPPCREMQSNYGKQG